MSNPKLPDSEIVKALECCVRFKQICPETCPMVNVRQCKVDLRKNTLALINRQKAEIERLSNEVKSVTECKFESVSQAAKSEAYEEFAERLESIMYEKYQKYDDQPYPIATISIIDDLLKELKGND